MLRFHRVVVEKRFLHNGGLNLHIMQNAQGCQSGIRRIPKIDPSKILKLQKNVVWTLKQGYLEYFNPITVEPAFIKH
jgi:hypothetical protein